MVRKDRKALSVHRDRKDRRDQSGHLDQSGLEDLQVQQVPSPWCYHQYFRDSYRRVQSAPRGRRSHPMLCRPLSRRSLSYQQSMLKSLIRQRWRFHLS